MEVEKIEKVFKNVPGYFRKEEIISLLGTPTKRRYKNFIRANFSS